MTLNESQLARFGRQGFLLLEEVFSPEEVGVLTAALPEVADPQRTEAVLDRKSGTVRMAHGIHSLSDAFRRLAFHPRLVGLAERLLGGPVYVYQSRLNLKAPFRESAAAGYPWHQDFSTWHFRDGLPEPRALVTITFLDEVTACNAPVMVFPGSHRAGLLGQREQGGEFLQVVLGPDLLQDLAAAGGVEAVTGPPGAVLLMDCNLVHASTENISPLRRALCSVIYSALDNQPSRVERDDRYVPREITAVQPLEDDCLRTLAG